MFTQHDFSLLWKRAHPYLAHPPALKIIAVAAAVLGAGVMAALSDASTGSPSTSSISPQAEQQQAAAAESVCEKQAWPYIVQRCADPAAYERGTRQVRVVTDRGAMVTMTMPNPIVEPKRPAPQATAVVSPRRQAPTEPQTAMAAARAMAKASAKPSDKREAKQHKAPERREKAVPPEVVAVAESVTGDSGHAYGAVQRVYIVPQ